MYNKPKPENPEADRPQPREAYGNLVTTGTRSGYSNHKPGHEKSRPPAAKAAEQAKLPPHNPDKVPKTSLAERIRRGLAGKEQKP
jgi:hypothetical protein